MCRLLPLRCRREADTVCSWGSYLRVAARSCQAVPFPQALNRVTSSGRVPLAKTLKISSASLARRVNQDLRDVCEKNVLTNGRSAVLPHWGHAAVALSCSLRERVMLTSRRQLSQ